MECFVLLDLLLLIQGKKGEKGVDGDKGDQGMKGQIGEEVRLAPEPLSHSNYTLLNHRV